MVDVVKHSMRKDSDGLNHMPKKKCRFGKSKKTGRCLKHKRRMTYPGYQPSEYEGTRMRELVYY